jgi:hypothetical protein
MKPIYIRIYILINLLKTETTMALTDLTDLTDLMDLTGLPDGWVPVEYSQFNREMYVPAPDNLPIGNAFIWHQTPGLPTFVLADSVADDRPDKIMHITAYPNPEFDTSSCPYRPAVPELSLWVMTGNKTKILKWTQEMPELGPLSRG